MAKDTSNDFVAHRVVTNALSGNVAAPENDVVFELNRIMLRRVQREESDREEQIRQMEQVRQQTKEGVERQEAKRLADQAQCDHKKEDGRTRLGGQKAGDGFVYLHCSQCFKEFSNKASANNPWPLNLQPPMERVGGPNM